MSQSEPGQRLGEGRAAAAAVGRRRLVRLGQVDAVAAERLQLLRARRVL